MTSVKRKKQVKKVFFIVSGIKDSIKHYQKLGHELF